MDTLHHERSSGDARTMTRRPTTMLGIVVIIGALALSACAGLPSAPAETTDAAPPPTETATPAPTPVPGSVAPESRYDLDCDDLVPADLVSALMGGAVGPADPLATAASAGPSIPRMTSVVAIGGLACEWSNGEPDNSQFGTNPAYVGLLVTVVPMPDAGWSSRAAKHGMPQPGEWCEASFCSMTRATADAWIAAESRLGEEVAADSAAAAAVADAAAAAIEAASPSAAPTQPDSAIPTECEALVPTTAVESLTGTSGLVATTSAGGWSEWAEAMSIAGNGWCRWTTPDTEESVAAVSWIRGGRWAADRLDEAGALVPAGSDPALDLTAPDRALLRCTEYTCTVDLVVGADWLQVQSDDEGQAVAIAREVAAGLLG